MPIEATDLIIVMKPRDEWKKASNKAEMDEAIESVLAEIPGVAFSLQQPIQMRFNELMTNAKNGCGDKTVRKRLRHTGFKRRTDSRCYKSGRRG
jgi:Cu/Ag efflux pump CusA